MYNKHMLPRGYQCKPTFKPWAELTAFARRIGSQDDAIQPNEIERLGDESKPTSSSRVKWRALYE